MMSFSFGFLCDTAQSSTGESSVEWFQNLSRSIAALAESNKGEPLSISPPRHRTDFDHEIVELSDGLRFKKVIYQDKPFSIDEVSDLIPGEYGGGLKVWESAIDLVLYMKECRQSLPFPTSCNVIELGCGQGLPGIYAMQLGYNNVTFSDFNQEVLDEVTWPNILLNCPKSSSQNVKCISGDWMKFHSLLLSSNSPTQSSFELVLSAETLYSIETCEKVAFFLYHHLSQDGVALLATKRFYFGVGGGTYEFERILNSLPQKPFVVTVVKSIEDGVSNIRDILIVQWQK